MSQLRTRISSNSTGHMAQVTTSPGAGVAFVDDHYCPVAEATVSVLDFGFTRSDVTYDVVHVWKGRFFRLEDHLDRFLRSLTKSRMSLAYDREEVRSILIECVRRSGLADAYVAMVCTRGLPPVGTRDPQQCRNRFIAYAIPFVWIATPEQREKGLRLIISSVLRTPPESVDPTVKNYNWRDLERGLFDALDRGGDTVVIVDSDGNVTEGPGFNVFAVREGEVITPDRGVLEGITRQTVLELCAEIGVNARLGKIGPDELRGADEVFIGSTAGGIIPIASVDGHGPKKGSPGPLTRRLSALYWSKHEAGWHGTPVPYESQ